MKVTFVCEPVLSALHSVIGAVAKKTTLPVLNNVLVQSDGREWKITGSDLELTLTARVELATEAFAVCLPAKRLLDVLKSFAKDAIVGMSIEENKATIRSGRSRFSFNTIAAEEYPTIQHERLSPVAKLDCNVFASLIEATQHAMAFKDVRYYLNGLLFDFSQFDFVVVGTDGHRLAKHRTALAEPTHSKQLIVPRDSIHAIAKLLGNDESCEISVETSEFTNSKGEQELAIHSIVIDVDRLTLTTKLIDCKFPDYRNVIPKNQPIAIELNRTQLLDTIKRVGLVLDGYNSGIAMEFSENGLRLVARANEEEADESIDIENGSDLVIGMNARYIIDALSALESDTVVLGFTDANSSMRIESSNRDESVHVVMPMRL